MQAEIITIGDEILIGQIVDTNSVFLGKDLNKAEVSIYQITSVQNDRTHILNTLKAAEEHADIIIITGGLIPTKDDITKHTLCKYFEDTLVQNVRSCRISIFKRYQHPHIKYKPLTSSSTRQNASADEQIWNRTRHVVGKKRERLCHFLVYPTK